MEHKYLKPDKEVWINQDESLKPICINISKVIEKTYKFWNPSATECPILSPEPEKIVNYGLAPKDQYFKRTEIPRKLKELQRQKDGRADDIWKVLVAHQENYAEEIEFIRQEWYFTLYGRWYYINGKPVWIPPTTYEYLTYCTGNYSVMDVKLKRKVSSMFPEFRFVDVKIDIAHLYLYTCTETFKHLDKNGVAIPEEDGTYEMVDTGRLLFFGDVNPKNRRRGETGKALSKLYGLSKIIAGPQAYSSICANAESTSKNHWNSKFVPMWRKMPFFFKPITDSSNRPKTEISFKAPAGKEGSKNFNTNVSTESLELDGKIDFSPIVSRSYYDHAKITGIILLDEEGKTEQIDIYEDWNLVKPTMSQGAESERNRFAFSYHPSTVEDMEGGVGVAYKKLCDASDFYQRGRDSGQTKSGLALIFVPTEDGLENFVGPYGESIIEDPTPEQAAFTGWIIGSRQYIKSKIAEYESNPTVDNLRKLAQFKRQNPPTYADIWRGGSGDIGFNIKKLDDHMDYWRRQFSLENDPRERGNLVWVVPGRGVFSAEDFLRNRLDDYDIPDAYVDWRPDAQGRFLFSKKLEPAQTNRVTKDPDTGHYIPTEEIYSMGVDPNEFHNANQAKAREDKSGTSYYTAVVAYPFSEDEVNKPIEDCESGRFVGSYYAKIDDVNICNEEMLMCARYWGTKVNHERNQNQIEPYFIKRGYAGMLFYAFLPEKNDFRGASGYKVGAEQSMDTLINAIREHIGYYMHDPHIEIYEQFRKFNSKDDLTKLDLASAAGGALIQPKQLPLNKGYKKLDPKENEGEGYDPSDIYGNEY